MSIHSGYLLLKVQERFKLWHLSGQQTFVKKLRRVMNVFDDVFQNNAQRFYIFDLLFKLMIAIPLSIHYFNFVYNNPHMYGVLISKIKF